MPTEVQMLVPHPDPERWPLEVIAVHPHAGRLERCPHCDQVAWTAFGHARRLAERCAPERRQQIDAWAAP